MTCIKNAIILFFLLALHGCSHNKYMEILTGENGFYWDIIQDANRKFSKPVYSYFFDTNGGCIYYAYMKYPNKPIKRLKFDYGDVVYPQTWKLNSDTLEIQGFKNKIVSITKDKIVLLERNESKDTLVLQRSNFKG